MGKANWNKAISKSLPCSPAVSGTGRYSGEVSWKWQCDG